MKSASEIVPHLPPGKDIYAFAEVQAGEDISWLEELHKLSSRHYEAFTQPYGGNQTLSIYVADTIAVLEHRELNNVNCDGKGRASIALHLKPEAGDDFWIVVVHLRRRNRMARACEAVRLRNWMLTKPRVVAIGDFNLDIESREGGSRDPAFYKLVGGDIDWIRPQNREQPTHCSRHRSLLDLVFVRGLQGTAQTSDIPCNKAENPSDHRWIEFKLEGKNMGKTKNYGGGYSTNQRIGNLENMFGELRDILEDFKQKPSEQKSEPGFDWKELPLLAWLYVQAAFGATIKIIQSIAVAAIELGRTVASILGFTVFLLAGLFVLVTGSKYFQYGLGRLGIINHADSDQPYPPNYAAETAGDATAAVVEWTTGLGVYGSNSDRSRTAGNDENADSGMAEEPRNVEISGLEEELS